MKKSSYFLYFLGMFWICIFTALVLHGVYSSSIDEIESDIAEKKEQDASEEKNFREVVEKDIIDEKVVEEKDVEEKMLSEMEDKSSFEVNKNKEHIALGKTESKQRNIVQDQVTRIELSPNASIHLEENDSQVFTAKAYSSSGKEIDFTAKWETNAGTIEKIHNNKVKLTVDDINQPTCWLRCTDIKTQLNANVYVNVKEKPRLDRFSISQLPSTCHSGESYSIIISAYDQFGNHFEIEPEWETDAGTIDAYGNFIAGSDYGQHKIVLRDRVSGKSVSSFVSIKPLLAVIDLYGTKESLRPGESFQYRAVCYDRNRREIDFPVEWSVTGGEVDSNGNLTPGHEPGTYEIFVAGVGSDVRVGMYYEVMRVVTTIKLTDVPDYLYSGDSYEFGAVAYDQVGKKMRFDGKWRAGGGRITGSGEYTAGNQPGRYKVVVAVGDVNDSAYFVVKELIKEKNFNLGSNTHFSHESKKIVHLSSVDVSIYRDGSYVVNYDSEVFERERWSYRLSFNLSRGGSFSVSPGSVNRSKGYHNFTQNGTSDKIRRHFTNIDDVDGDFR
ncbi:hypothetical protein [Candidatus Uabimicrobium sp. HlEnr_7]|uniref:hypothetical protein n=1 Tax=Candidatus Uabimicrobium helgolandensis TaxID=3095367 RepID=UPI003558D38E